METPELGRMLGKDELAPRDAVHVAIVGVEAAEHLKPGQRIGLDHEGKATALPMGCVAIVDPFLGRDVRPGERFYACLLPGQVQSVRHAWIHAAFTPRVRKLQPLPYPDVEEGAA